MYKNVLLCLEYMRCSVARLLTVMAVLEFFSSSLHKHASRRLVIVHELLLDGEHHSCRDWFECLLRTKTALWGDSCSEEVNYFNG